MSFTSAVNPYGVSNTLQMKVSLEIERVSTILILPYIDMSLEDQALAYQKIFGGCKFFVV